MSVLAQPPLPGFPELPTPTEILAELLGYLGELVINRIVAWIGRLANPIVDWVTVNWSLSTPSGLLGGLLETLFQFSLGIMGGFMVVAIMLVFVQRWLVTIFPNLFATISVGQMLGRVVIVSVLLSLGIRTQLALLIDGTSGMALSFAGGAITLAGPSGGEWSWLPNLISLILNNPNAIEFFGIGLILIALTIFALIGALLIKQLAAVLLLGVLPIVATAWLFALTESVWATYWWLLIKVTLLPIVLAFFLHLIMAILVTVATSSFLVASLLIVVVQFVGMFLAFKFLTFSLGKVLSHPVVLRTLGTVGGVTMLARGNVAAGATTLATTFGGVGAQRGIHAIRRVKRASEVAVD